jgi:hypothetical protein
MNKFFVLDPYNSDCSRFETEAAAVKHIEEEARDHSMLPAEFISDHDIVIVEGVEMLYKPPRDGASLVQKGK